MNIIDDIIDDISVGVSVIVFWRCGRMVDLCHYARKHYRCCHCVMTH